jgi:hypothetical protein
VLILISLFPPSSKFSETRHLPNTWRQNIEEKRPFLFQKEFLRAWYIISDFGNRCELGKIKAQEKTGEAGF